MRRSGTSDLVVRSIFYTFVFVTALVIAYTFKLLFVPLLVSILLTFVMEPLVNFFESKGIGRVSSVVGIYFVAILVVAILLAIAGPKIVEQARSISLNMPTYKMKLLEISHDITVKLQDKFPNTDIPNIYLALSKYLAEKGGINFSVVIGYLTNFFALLSVLVIIPIVTFFLIVDGHIIQKAVFSLVPNSYFEMSVLLFYKVTEALKLFIRGQVIDATAVAILTTIGMGIIGLPYFFLVGIIAGVGNLIPYLGPIIGFVPAVLVIAMSPSGFTIGSLAAVVIVFALVQFIEGTFVYPIAVGKSVNLHPLVVIIGVTVGGQLGGILGMLISIPLISITKVTYQVMHTYLKSYKII